MFLHLVGALLKYISFKELHPYDKLEEWKTKYSVRHLLNAKHCFISWWRPSFKEVNDLALKLKKRLSKSRPTTSLLRKIILHLQCDVKAKVYTKRFILDQKRCNIHHRKLSDIPKKNLEFISFKILHFFDTNWTKCGFGNSYQKFTFQRMCQNG